jgi:hypothetical protein
VLEAERQYSAFALDSVAVEGMTALPKIEHLMYEFTGGHAVLREDEVIANIRKVEPDRNQWNGIVDQLVMLSFIGPEARPGSFEFPSDDEEYQKVRVMARKMREGTGASRRYRIHPAFWSYLEIKE